MSSSRVVVVAGLVAALGSVFACSAPEQMGKDESAVSVSSAESELKLTGGTRYLGKIESGETKTGTYYNPPRYRSYGFDAKAGDKISVTVSSVYGDAVSYITDSKFNVLAYNDDANANTLDSKMTYEVPAGTAAKSYRIVFRDYDLLEATFTVSLTIRSTASSTCAYDGQTYQSGQSFPSTDGCNTCTCGSSGSVGCTKKACVCDPANEPDRNYLGTPQQCMTMRYTCPSGWSPFQNSCGCGCEH